MNSILIVNQLLRIKDNPLLIKAMKNKGLFAYYFLDRHSIEIGSKTFPNKSYFARKFELESLHNLKADLERLNIPLIIDQVGSDHLATLIDRYSIESLYSIDFATSNERRFIDKAIKKAKNEVTWIKDHSDLLYPLQKLPFDVMELPEVFTVFRKKVERYHTPETSFDAPENPLSNCLSMESSKIPSLTKLGYSNNTHKDQMSQLIDSGMDKDVASENTEIMKAAKKELMNWEKNNKETRQVWKMMNDWVYDGFDKTYSLLGVSFDKNYYESETYLLGKNIMEEGLKKGVLYEREDSSVWINLDNEGLDEKLLLRSDGTSVYMTQDLGTAVQRIADNSNVKGMIYTVGNEQDYHFKVLFKILNKLGYDWADNLFHLSYGMVDLPSGKMKSREGTVVDADDLIYDLIDTVKHTSESLDKYKSNNETLDFDEYKKIALGALKYYILKVDPKKNILFNPEESIDLSGNTGPFIQYAYVRIQSILKKVNKDIQIDKSYKLNDKEKEVIKTIYEYPSVIIASYNELSPALIANYLYDLVRNYNPLYQNHHILNSETKESTSVRLIISQKTSHVIESACDLLGIDLPNRM